jgi:hypothetical protein
MKSVPKSLKLGLIIGLGLVLLINIAVFIAIFRAPTCPAVSETVLIEQSGHMHRPSTSVSNLILKGIDFLLGC